VFSSSNESQHRVLQDWENRKKNCVG
jgi:hypothetical protein